uniref:Uncharacterized protein n=1 Tax=Nelumbo nucifera TaxID=4432 RepID=A0A822YQX8_NELNU|nr:TPA_asm: hypothetical protein HUJ06_012631 [Nelumbo nucifera]
MPGTEQEVRINDHSSPSSIAFQAKQNGMTKKLPSDSVINLDQELSFQFEACALFASIIFNYSLKLGF